MKFRNLAIAGAALGLAASPAISATTSARASAPAAGESEMAGGGVYAIVAVAVLAAFVGLTIAADDNNPVSA